MEAFNTVLRFNSKLVRLKATNQRHTRPLHKMFQFQTGSIKRIRDYRSSHSEYRFNSKLVRLEDDTSRDLHPLTGFNSKLVRLKAAELVNVELNHEGRGFNSKLVRLKVTINRSNENCLGSFQFQTGSIKSQPRGRP